MADEVESTRAQPPAGFETVPLVDVKGCPLAEDVGQCRNKSLWLIRIPHNFDASLLSGKTAVINGTQEIPADVENGIERRYEVLCKTADASELASFRVLLPSVETESLCVAQPFSGQMSVIRSLNVPPPVVPSSPIAPQSDASPPVSRRGWETSDDQGKSKRRRAPVDSPPESVSKKSKSKKRQKEKDRVDEAQMVIEPRLDVESRRSKHKKRSHAEKHEIESPEKSHHGARKKKRKDGREDDMAPRESKPIKKPKESDLKKSAHKAKQLKVVLVKREKVSDSESSPKKKKKRK